MDTARPLRTWKELRSLGLAFWEILIAVEPAVHDHYECDNDCGDAADADDRTDTPGEGGQGGGRAGKKSMQRTALDDVVPQRYDLAARD